MATDPQTQVVEYQVLDELREYEAGTSTIVKAVKLSSISDTIQLRRPITVIVEKIAEAAYCAGIDGFLLNGIGVTAEAALNDLIKQVTEFYHTYNENKQPSVEEMRQLWGELSNNIYENKA